MISKPEPTKPIDCFTDKQKLWAVEKLREELPEEWQRLVNRQAENREVHTVPNKEKENWLLDGLNVRKAISTLPFDFGDDGWELNRHSIINQALVDAAIKESLIHFPTPEVN